MRQTDPSEDVQDKADQAGESSDGERETRTQAGRQAVLEPKPTGHEHTSRRAQDGRDIEGGETTKTAPLERIFPTVEGALVKQANVR